MSNTGDNIWSEIDASKWEIKPELLFDSEGTPKFDAELEWSFREIKNLIKWNDQDGLSIYAVAGNYAGHHAGVFQSHLKEDLTINIEFDDIRGSQRFWCKNGNELWTKINARCGENFYDREAMIRKF